MARALILGATSSIARELARQLAAGGYEVYLAGRDSEELERIRSDLEVRGSRAVALELDALEGDRHQAWIENCWRRAGGFDLAVWAIGALGRQPEDSHHPGEARRLLDVNLAAAFSLLAPLANLMEAAGSGTLVGLSSVAGDRGRRSNYAYGAAKAGLTVFLEGLWHRLSDRGVRVHVVKLGFVDTAMTYGLPGLFLVASPEKVAATLLRRIELGHDGVYYVPFFWWGIMQIIRHLPQVVFKRLKL